MTSPKRPIDPPVGSTYAQLVDDLHETPDFAEMFTRPPGEDEPWLEPRAAYALWTMLELAEDELLEDHKALAENDLREDPLRAGMQLPRWPRLHGQVEPAFVLNLVEATCALADDLAGGELPRPRNTAEEMALYLAIKDAEAWIADEAFTEPEWLKLPGLEQPFDESRLLEMLFEDTDFLLLFNPALDGFEDGSAADDLRTANLAKEHWFRWFRESDAREPKYVAANAVDEVLERAARGLTSDTAATRFRNRVLVAQEALKRAEQKRDQAQYASLNAAFLQAECVMRAAVFEALKVAWQDVTRVPWLDVE